MKTKILNTKVGHKVLKVDDFITDSFLQKVGYANSGYAIIREWNSESKKRIGSLVHRVIMNAPHGMQVDHINGDRLDNRIENLRIVNQSQNNYNAKLRDDNKSREKGISYCDEKGTRKSYQWRCSLWINNKNIQKRFNSKEDAIKYRDELLKGLNEIYELSARKL